MAILQEVKSTSLRMKDLLTEDDFRKIAQGVLGASARA
jgi:hypothetical protein